jgi:hypothetical protein
MKEEQNDDDLVLTKESGREGRGGEERRSVVRERRLVSGSRVVVLVRAGDDIEFVELLKGRLDDGEDGVELSVGDDERRGEANDVDVGGLGEDSLRLHDLFVGNRGNKLNSSAPLRLRTEKEREKVRRTKQRSQALLPLLLFPCSITIAFNNPFPLTSEIHPPSGPTF